MTVTELFEQYYQFKDLRFKSIEVKRMVVKHFLTAFGDIPIEQVTSQLARDFQGYLQKNIRAKRDNSYSVNTYIGNFAAAFSWASKKGYIPENPFEMRKKLPVPEIEREIFTPEEIDRILQVADLEMSIAIMFGLCGGLRRSAALNVIVSDIDFATNRITVGHKEETAFTWRWRSKNNKTVTFFAPLRLMNLLTIKHDMLDRQPYVALTESDYRLMIRKKNTGKITEKDRGLPIGAFNRRFNDTQKRAGFRPRRFHDLRVTYATTLAGCPDIINPKELQSLMGHSCMDTTWKHYVQANKKKAAEKAESVISKVFMTNR